MDQSVSYLKNQNALNCAPIENLKSIVRYLSVQPFAALRYLKKFDLSIPTLYLKFNLAEPYLWV